MSFSIFPLFSFFQQPNTGVLVPNYDSTIALGENGRSGTVADFNWYYPYANTNVPLNVVATWPNTPVYNIFTDSSTNGLTYPRISNAMSGDIVGNKNYFSVGNSFIGVVSPKGLDAFQSFNSFSGLVTGKTPDAQIFSSIVSGSFNAEKNDVKDHLSNQRTLYEKHL